MSPGSRIGLLGCLQVRSAPFFKPALSGGVLGSSLLSKTIDHRPKQKHTSPDSPGGGGSTNHETPVFSIAGFRPASCPGHSRACLGGPLAGAFVCRVLLSLKLRGPPKLKTSPGRVLGRTFQFDKVMGKTWRRMRVPVRGSPIVVVLP